MLKEYLFNKKHHIYRKNITISFDKSMSPEERMAYRFKELCKAETPVILPKEKICFMRTVKNIPDIFTSEEWTEIKKKQYIHELGYMSNLSPNYERIIKDGLLKTRESVDKYGKCAIYVKCIV